MKKCISSVLAFIMAISMLAALPACSSGSSSQSGSSSGSTADSAPKDKADPLSLWSDDSELKKTLVPYIESVTDPNSKDFIPEEDRIAVSDMDGTLYCETDPVYLDHMLYMYRVLEDPDYKDKSSDFEKQVAARVQKFIDTGVQPSDLDEALGKASATAFSGMTLDEFNDYVKAYKNQPMPGYKGMTRGEAFYQPMVQMVKYLQDNGFTFYVVSGCDRYIIRGLFEDNVIDIPNSQIIGTDVSVVASGQGENDPMSYKFQPDDELVIGDEFIIKNGQMNKVTAIDREIGKQPVLSFGNSSGDTSMANYVINDNPYRALAFMNCCDDLARENGNKEKADQMYALCKQYGWIPVSMKNDWITIYGEGVTYSPSSTTDSAA